MFISSNPDFRLPRDNSIPIIMIGPGTGISPFRAFIQERGVASATNLLYFGCRHRNKDYLYKDELGRRICVSIITENGLLYCVTCFFNH